MVEYNIIISKTDWDSFETSWDFKRHPLVRGAATVAEAYAAWAAECETRFSQLKANEEELNRIFIDIYGLQDELTPEVEDKDVTVRRADLGRDIRSLISYAVGCMFGRYSLDVEGLAYAGGRWDASKYKAFQPDKDAILPICDDEYFEDDITGRFVQWVEAVYGRPALEENLKFIADALGGRGSPREAIRSYFLNGFYADHCKIYQKRPIYWLFDSGKRAGSRRWSTSTAISRTPPPASAPTMSTNSRPATARRPPTWSAGPPPQTQRGRSGWARRWTSSGSRTPSCAAMRRRYTTWPTR